MTKEVMYLTEKNHKPFEVTNWDSSKTFKVISFKKSRHNIGRIRQDFWFKGEDNYIWHGYQIGDNNTVAHCQPTKRVRL